VSGEKRRGGREGLNQAGGRRDFICIFRYLVAGNLQTGVPDSRSALNKPRSGTRSGWHTRSQSSVTWTWTRAQKLNQGPRPGRSYNARASALFSSNEATTVFLFPQCTAHHQIECRTCGDGSRPLSALDFVGRWTLVGNTELFFPERAMTLRIVERVE
jgi:hypothetical protein